MRANSTKITALLCSIVTISLVAVVIFIGGNKNSMEDSDNSILKFNAKLVSYIPEEASNKEGLPKEGENLEKQDSSSNKDKEKIKKEEIPSFEGLTGIEFVKYTVKATDTLWEIVEENMPNYKSYPVGGVAGVVLYVGKENNLNKDSNDSYIVYSGQKITIPREKNIAMKSNENKNDNSSVIVNTNLSVTKKTNITTKSSTITKPSTNNTSSRTQKSTTSSEGKTESSSSNIEENTSNHVSGEHTSH